MTTPAPRFHWIRCAACAGSHTSVLDVALCHVDRDMVDAGVLVAAQGGPLAVARDIVWGARDRAEADALAAEYA